jgi:hypothetical protein
MLYTHLSSKSECKFWVVIDISLVRFLRTHLEGANTKCSRNFEDDAMRYNDV